MKVKVVGAGLAGCEAAYQLLKRGAEVELVEMRPEKFTPAHKTAGFAELVCSNSLKSMDPDTSSGALKTELAALDSLILRCAYSAKVEAGGALAVDRVKFSAAVENELRSFPNLTVTTKEEVELSDEMPVIYATGPLTSDRLCDSIFQKNGKDLHFFDAIAPIVDKNSIDMSKAFYGGRYNKGGDDYLNLPMNKEEYLAFYDALISAKTVELKDFEGTEVFEGCMPIEVMAKRGADTMRFGPLKPVGLFGPNGEKYYAVVQLRKETSEGAAFNMVGFQTNLTYGEQKRVFGMIPALREAEFLRYGVMHRNTYLDSPRVLDETFKLKNSKNIYFAGQITGVEGYMESAMSGLLAAIFLYREQRGLEKVLPSENTVCGALTNYIAHSSDKNFQPMNSNFGILPDIAVRDKKLRKKLYAERSKNDIRVFADIVNV